MNAGGNDGWLESALRAAAPRPPADDGFTAAVMARVSAMPRVVAPAVALVAVRRAERSLLRQRRWNLGGVLVGGVVALLAVQAGAEAHGVPAIAGAAIALLAGSVLLAWLAIARG